MSEALLPLLGTTGRFGKAVLADSSAGSSQTDSPLFMLYQYLRPSGSACSNQFYTMLMRLKQRSRDEIYRSDR